MVTGAWAQDSGDSGGQVPLGDMVRQQREQRRHSKTAKRVVSDDDIPASHMRWINAWVAEYRIIPAVKISGLIPNDDFPAASSGGEKKGKMGFGFGPHLGQTYWCDDSLDCAEEAFLRGFQRPGWAGSRTRILFDSSDSVGDFEARIAHFEIVHDLRGKMQGTVALIGTPVSTVMAYCIYNAEDRNEVESQCDAFISSLRVEVPKRFIYVEHH